MSYIEVNDQNFDEIVRNSDKPVLIDFWAPWCAPCRMIAPLFESLSTKYEGKIKFAKVNVDINPQTAIKYNIQGIPTLIIMKEGKVFRTLVGVRQEEDYVIELNNVLGEKNNLGDDNGFVKNGIININGTQEFVSTLEKNKDKLVLVDFWAPWCGPCRMVAPVLEQLSKDFVDKIQVIKVNVDEFENQELAQQFQVSSIPTLAFIKDGQNPEISVGAIPYEQLKEYIQKKI